MTVGLPRWPSPVAIPHSSSVFPSVAFASPDFQYGLQEGYAEVGSWYAALALRPSPFRAGRTTLLIVSPLAIPYVDPPKSKDEADMTGTHRYSGSERDVVFNILL